MSIRPGVPLLNQLMNARVRELALGTTPLQGGIGRFHRWVTQQDERVRPAHRELHGEVRPVGARFSNGARYPGDPFVEPAQYINCRCDLEPASGPEE